MLGFRSRITPLSVALVVLMLASCGRDEPSGFVLHAGDSWFDLLDEVAVLDIAPTNLSDDVSALVASDSPERWIDVPRDSWRRIRDVPDEERIVFHLSERAGVWRSPAKLHFPITRETALLRIGETLLKPHGQMEGAVTESQLLHWWDGESECFVLTGTPDEPLMAIAHEPPSLAVAPKVSPTVAQYDVGEDIIEAGQLERHVELELVHRRALLAPAPSRLALTVDHLAGNALELAVGVVDHAFAADDGIVLKREQLSDGVTFAVDVRAGESTTRVWSEHVLPGAGWQERLVDLSSFQGRAVTLELVTEPGPDGEASFDYGLWSELRLRGKTSAPDRPHIVLLHLDTLRSDRLGCYGCELPTSPNLDAWAAERAVVFEDATVDASFTLPSTGSLLSGLTQHQHLLGIHPYILTYAHEPLALRLRESGYETLAMSEGVYVNPSFGFASGFDVFDWRTRQDPDWAQALEWLDTARSGRPVFLFLQTFLAHHPFEGDDERLGPGPGDDYEGWMRDIDVSWQTVIGPYVMGRMELEDADREYFKRLYDAGVRRLDDRLGWLLAALEERFAGEDFLFIITSDHGDEHFEHGSLDHGHSLHGEVTRVPMIVRFPDRDAGRDMHPVSILDVAPTILDYAGLTAPAHLPGRSMRAALPASRLRVARRYEGEWAVQRDGWKLIIPDELIDDPRILAVIPEQIDWGSEAPTSPERQLGHRGVHVEARLYDLSNDPGEFTNVIDAHAPRVAELLGALAAYLERTPRPERLEEMPGIDMNTLDAATLEGLREMGYLDK